jgi:hypothetical protein
MFAGLTAPVVYAPVGTINKFSQTLNACENLPGYYYLCPENTFLIYKFLPE